MPSKTETPSYRFTTIESRFELASYRWFDGKWCPAVAKADDGTVRIRIVVSRTQRGDEVTDKFDYFEINADGVITKVPRGLTREFKGCRVRDLDKAVEQYAKDDPSVPRLSF